MSNHATNPIADLNDVLQQSPGLRYLGDGCFFGETADEALITPAKQVLAQVYVDLEFYTQDDVDPATGMFKPEHDEPHTRARYFVSGRIDDGQYEFRAMARLIGFDAELGLESFPITVEAPIESELHDQLAQGQFPRAQEVSELTANPAMAGSSRRVIEGLYAAMFQTAVRENHEVWIIAARPILFKQIQRRFTSECVRQMSPIRERPGEIVIPSLIDIARLPKMIATTLEAAQASGSDDRLESLKRTWARYLNGLTVEDFADGIGERLVAFDVL